MDFSRVDVWSGFLNIAGICLWGITMLYFILRKKGKNIQNGSVKRVDELNVLSFGDEIFTKMLKQQSERSFRRISNAIKKESFLLGKLIENGAINNAQTALESKPYYHKKLDLNNKSKKSHSCLKAADKYSEAVRFVELGMSSKKISEELKIPRGEIELLIKLRKQKRKQNVSNSPHVEAFF